MQQSFDIIVLWWITLRIGWKILEILDQIYQITNVLVNAKSEQYAFISSSYNDHSFTKEKNDQKNSVAMVKKP